MEKKEYTPVFVAALAVVTILGFAGGGMAWLKLDKALKSQGRDLAEARKQLVALDQSLSNQQHEVLEARKQLAAVSNHLADAQMSNQSLNQQLAEIQSELREGKAVAQTQFPPGHVGPVTAPGIPAGASVEDQLRAEGKRWERTQGQIVLGSYVQDMLEGRLNQPAGRGCIGKVMSVVVDANGTPAATVDFGRGFVVGLNLSELSLIRFLGPDLR
jgi:DNA-binding transcriptional MerR regulator